MTAFSCLRDFGAMGGEPHPALARASVLCGDEQLNTATRVAPEKTVLRPSCRRPYLRTVTGDDMKTYREKLKDPRWQKMRLSILERDEFTCQICFNSENTLHVHHRYYAQVENPWDYPPHALVTLCEDCHESEGADMPRAGRALIDRLKEAGAFSFDIDYLAHVIEEFLNDENQSKPVDFRFWQALRHLILDSKTNPNAVPSFVDWYFAQLAANRLKKGEESEG